jgi:hypothetical protein
MYVFESAWLPSDTKPGMRTRLFGAEPKQGQLQPPAPRSPPIKLMNLWLLPAFAPPLNSVHERWYEPPARQPGEGGPLHGPLCLGLEVRRTNEGTTPGGLDPPLPSQCVDPLTNNHLPCLPGSRGLSVLGADSRVKTL